MTTTTSTTDRYELLSFSVTNDLHGTCCLDARVRVGAEVRDTRGQGSSSARALIDALRQMDIDVRGAAIPSTEASGRGDHEGDSEIDRLCAVIAACNRQERESRRSSALELAGV